MRKSILTFPTIIVFLISFSCTQQAPESEIPATIENTMKSMALYQDSVSIDMSKLLASTEKINMVIDSIGYPDAGYQIWSVKSKDTLNFRIMTEASWPDQKAYDIIHDHELYKKALEDEKSSWTGLKRIWYHRLTKAGN